MKKIISCLLVIVLLSLSFTSSAEATIPKQNQIIKESRVDLYNQNEKVIAYYFKTENGGYIIVESNGNDFIEYSTEPNSLNLKKTEKYYYLGIRSIYQQGADGIVKNYFDGGTICNNDIISTISSGELNTEKAMELAGNVLNNQKLLRASTTSGSLKKMTVAWSYNPDGRCGATATSILLNYYAKYKDSRFVSTDIPQNERGFIDYMTKWIPVSASYESVTLGLQKYLMNNCTGRPVNSIKGLNSTKVHNKIASYIKKDTPIIVGLLKEPRYGNHWAVGTGYASGVVVINDGHGCRNITVNMKYVDGCIFIE